MRERFVAEIPLRWSATNERIALARLRTAQRISNEALAHFLARANAYVRDPELRWLRAEAREARLDGRAQKRKSQKPARSVPSTVVPRRLEFATAAERNSAWQDLCQRYGMFGAVPVATLSDVGRLLYRLDLKYACSLTGRQKSLGRAGLDAASIHHEIIPSAKNRVLEYARVKKRKSANGATIMTGRPRFASRRNPVTSFTGSSSEKNKGALSVDIDARTLTWKAAGGHHALVGRLRIEADDAWLRKAIALPIRTVRVLHRDVRGKRRWYVQLTLEGMPPIAPSLRTAISDRTSGAIGIDIGSRHIAAVGVHSALLADLAPTMLARESARDGNVVDERDGDRRKRDKWYRRLQAKMSRAQRQANAAAVRHVAKTLTRTRDGSANGKIVLMPAGFRRGSKIVNSKRVRALQSQLAELARADEAARSCDHGRLVNTIATMGDSVVLERLSYVGWQRSFGRQVRRHAPGAFEAQLKRRAAVLGLAVESVPTRHKLSQLCHGCGGFFRQPIRGLIAQRFKAECKCGRKEVHRDLYSAFLARFAREGSSVDLQAASAAWTGARRLLSDARLTYDNAEDRRIPRLSRLPFGSPAGISALASQLQALDGTTLCAIGKATPHAPATVRDGAGRESDSPDSSSGGAHAHAHCSNTVQRRLLPPSAERKRRRSARARSPLESCEAISAATSA